MQLKLSDLPQEGIPSQIPINASRLKVAACPRRWMLTVFLGFQPVQDTIPLDFGKIVHKFAELVAFDRSPENLAQALTTTISLGRDRFGINSKEFAQLKGVLASCPIGLPGKNLPYPVRVSDKQAAEYKFQFKIDNHTGFYYTGTIDLISHDTQREILVINDYKTTRKYMLRDAISAYEGDPQFQFYYYIVNKFAYDIFKGDLVLANLAWYRKMVAKVLVVMIGNTSKPPSWTSATPDWSFTEEALREFGVMLDVFTQARYDDITSLNLPPPTGKLINACPQCPFKPLCFAQNKDQVDLYLSELTIKKYEPLTW